MSQYIHLNSTNFSKPRDLIVWGKVFIEKHEDLTMNFDIPFENDLIKKYCRESPDVSQSEKADDGKNGFLKMFINFRKFCGLLR